MSQRKYIFDLLKRFGMEDARPVSTPLDKGELVKPEVKDEEEMKKIPFQSLIGSLMYLAVATRPDIAYAVNWLSQFNTNYNRSHWMAAKRILRYLKGTLDEGLTYTKSGNALTGYVDADWGSCSIDRKSQTGFVFTLADCAITWESKKQQTVALSSTEAEYMALSEIAKEARYLNSFMDEIGFVEGRKPIAIYSDNQGAKRLAENSMYHSRTKHIDIRHHFVRETIGKKEIEIRYLSTDKMLADIFTKAVPGPKLKYCRENIGIGRLIVK